MLSEQETIDRINAQEPTYLERAKVKGYICPKCKAGSKKNGTGLVLGEDKKHYKCFSCGYCGDNLSLIGEVFNLTNHYQKLNKGCELYSLSAEYSKGRAINLQEVFKNESQQPQTDYTTFFNNAANHLTDTTYYRGINVETLRRFNVGYVAEWNHPQHPTAPKTPRLIIPTSNYSYFARDTRTNIPEGQKSYTKQKVGKVHFFNMNALYTATKPVFVVEGEFDALSIIDCGCDCVALGSVANVQKFIAEVTKKRPTQPLIVALDNDEAGRKAATVLGEGLENINLTYRIEENLSGSYKDCNELLLKDRFALVNNLGTATIAIYESVKANSKDYYNKNCVAAFLDDFTNGIKNAANTSYIPTGYQTLDTALEGGLFEGLYCIGAISSLGKTTFCLQLANQIAHNGNDVIVVSLEMGRKQLMGKSISLHTYLDCVRNNLDFKLAKTSRGITTGSRYCNYSEEEKELIQRAVNEFRKYSEHLFIFEGMGDITVERVRELVNTHIAITGNKPVVVIDYLQILAPYNDHATDKQNIDHSVVGLKCISRDYKIPVIAISSFNRENYHNKVNLTAFKESGAIEYTADVVLGIQHQAANNNDYDFESENKRNPRQLEVVVLKNREGEVYQHIPFEYYPMFNFYKDCSARNSTPLLDDIAEPTLPIGEVAAGEPEQTNFDLDFMDNMDL